MEQNSNTPEIGVQKKFSIASSAKAFEILSGSLYSDRILAIVRELSCNCYDSHVAAGKKNTPFKMHLPTAGEPYFSVEDFGIGLSHEDITNLYSTYFASEKAEQNDLIGSFGLGSKVPFCYTSEFRVISRHGGKERLYKAFVDGGFPALKLEQENDTNLTGMEVYFKVAASDFSEFQSKAALALEFFDPQPIFNYNIGTQKKSYRLQGDNWKIRKQLNSYSYDRSIRAIQGMVSYNVTKIDDSRMDNVQKQMMNQPIDLFFDIGELSVAPSRETLTNDDQTINAILSRLSEVYREVGDGERAKIAKCKTGWEGRLAIIKLSREAEYYGIERTLLNLGDLFTSYPNFDLSDVETVEKIKINSLKYPAINLSRFERATKAKSGYARKYPVFKVTEEDRYQAILAKLDKENDDNYLFRVPVIEDTLFVINDVGFGGEKYLHHHLQVVKAANNAYLISSFNASMKETLQDTEKLLTSLGNPKHIYLSSLKIQYGGNVTKIATPWVKRDLFIFNEKANVTKDISAGYERKAWNIGWDPVSNFVPAVGKNYYYVSLKRMAPDGFDFAEDFKDFITNVRKALVFGIQSSDVIYGVPEGNPPTGTQWIEFRTFVFNQIKSLVTPQRELEISLMKSGNILYGFNDVIKYILSHKPLNSLSPMQIFAEKLESAKEKPETEGLRRVADFALAKGKFKYKTLTDFDAEWEKVKSGYPMLSCIYNPPTYEIIEYVKLIDKENGIE